MWCKRVSIAYILQITEAREFYSLQFKKDSEAKLGTEFLFPEFQSNELRVRKNNEQNIYQIQIYFQINVQNLQDPEVIWENEIP